MMIIINRESNIIAINFDNIESISNCEDGHIKFNTTDYIYPTKIYEPQNRRNKIFMDLISAYANGEKVFFMPEE